MASTPPDGAARSPATSSHRRPQGASAPMAQVIAAARARQVAPPTPRGRSAAAGVTAPAAEAPPAPSPSPVSPASHAPAAAPAASVDIVSAVAQDPNTVADAKAIVDEVMGRIPQAKGFEFLTNAAIDAVLTELAARKLGA